MTSETIIPPNLLPDQEARDAARRLLRQNLVIEAGAGTGKTTLLTDRLLFLLFAGGPRGAGLPLTELVALTFTEKAAAEIRLRLTGKLSDILAVLDNKPLPARRAETASALLQEARDFFDLSDARMRQAAIDALRNMDRAQIGTIHSFAAHILRLYPLESRVDPAFQVDADFFQWERLFRDEWAVWLDGELGTDAPRAAAWLDVLRLAPLSDIEELARAMCAENAAAFSSGKTAWALFEPARRFHSLSEKMARLRQGKPPPAGNSQILRHMEDLEIHFDRIARVLDSPAPLVETWRKENEKEKGWPKAWPRDGDEEVYLQAVRLANAASAEAQALVSAAMDLVRPFALRFHEKYGRRGHISFDGLLRHARDMLRRDFTARDSLKRRFSALLIDEFQDTDPVQGEVLIYLAEARGARAARWSDVKLEAGKLFVVGDPKQSIYRFRGADIRAYDKFTGLMLAQGAAKSQLFTNFRGTAALLDPVNNIFENLMRQAGELQPAHVALAPGLRLSTGRPALEWAVTPEARDVEDQTRAEARWIASWISQKIHAAPEEERFSPRDVAILCRSATHLSALLEALKDARVPHIVEVSRYFYGTQEVIDFTNLLRVMDDPSDSLSLVGLLRSPLVGLTDRDVLALAEADAFSLDDAWQKAALTPEGKIQVESFWSFWAAARARVGHEPLADFVAWLLAASPLLELCTAAYFGEQTLANLQKFARLAMAAGADRGASLKEFLSEVARSMKDESREGESSLADERLDAVRVLSIHKAKGLEFPVVVLPYMSSAPPRGQNNDESVARWDWSTDAAGFRLPKTKAADAVWALLAEEERARESHERVRLLYVALTRAQKKMVLVGGPVKDKDSFAALLDSASFWPRPGDAERMESLLKTGPVHTIDGLDHAAPAPPEQGGEVPTFDPARVAELWRKRRAEKDLLSARRLITTPTALARDGDQPFIPAPVEVRELEEGAPLRGLAAVIGDVCHLALEHWDFKAGGNLQEAVNAACRELWREGVEFNQDKANAAAVKILEGFFKSPAVRALAQAEILGREVPFVLARPGQVVRGAMDILFREKGKIWVADYKTDDVPPGGEEVHAALYRVQGEAYVEAVQKSLGEQCGFQLIFLRTGKIVRL